MTARLAGAAASISISLLAATAAAQDPPAPAPVPAATPDARDIAQATPVSKAVDRALELLAGSQLPDGSWPSGFGKSTGIVSVALLAFLASGHPPGPGKHGKVVERGLRWVLASGQPDGLLAYPGTQRSMYCHGMSTLLLGEVFGMVDEDRQGFERFEEVYRKAVELILRAQNVAKEPVHVGGWRYEPGSADSDLSAVGWQVLALRAALSNGLAVPRNSVEAAVGYVKRCAVPAGGFAYQPGGGPSAGRTGIGLLCLQLCGDAEAPEVRRGGDYIAAAAVNPGEGFFFYGVYYATQGMYQLGGRHWTEWQKRAEPVLLASQLPDGSWRANPADSHETSAGPAFTTALAVQALTVSYRLLPIYQR
ncbi:MAG: terpene cyclase/mutase family protein [Planctomycetes bacterium]|nr:terpene cyclase/mutase family protein [Planctomycetota bacterium]